jgi:hypothetical protein
LECCSGCVVDPAEVENLADDPIIAGVAVVKRGDLHRHACLLPEDADVRGDERDEEGRAGHGSVRAHESDGVRAQLIGELRGRLAGLTLTCSCRPCDAGLCEALLGDQDEVFGEVVRISTDRPEELAGQCASGRGAGG